MTAPSLLDALKVAKASKHGVPMHVQNTIEQIAGAPQSDERRAKANEIARWLYQESQAVGVDPFTQIGYNALRSALEPYMEAD